MIKFKFEMNDKIKNFVIENRKKEVKLTFLIALSIFLIPLIVVGVIYRENFYVKIIIITLSIMSLIMAFVLCRYDSPLNAFKESEPQEIIILDDTIETTGSEKFCYKQYKLYDVKRIIDYGYFYVFIFYFPNLDKRFICQKDLIVKGTIEEFEQIFEDKIVRKVK